MILDGVDLIIVLEVVVVGVGVGGLVNGGVIIIDYNFLEVFVSIVFDI